MRIIYTVTRKVQDSTTIGQTRDFILDVKSIAKTVKMHGNSPRSLSGNRQTVVHRVEKKYKITTLPIVAANTGILEDFLYSVIEGEQFFVNFETDLDNANYLFTAKLDTEEYSPQHVSRGMFSVFTFDIVEV